MKNLLIYVLTILAIILLAYFTRPIAFQATNDMSDKCFKDMQINKELICD